MKIAFVHDRIVSIGGAEKVLFDLIKNEESNDIKIFTIFSNKKFIEINGKKIEIVSVISNNFLLTKVGYRNFMPLFPLLSKILSHKISKYNPNKIIISSFAVAKNIDWKGYKKLYLHSPMQYIWDHYDEYINKFNGIKKIFFILSSKYLRKRDLNYKTFDEVVFNSNYTQKLAKKIYGISGKVQYPVINNVFIDSTISNEIHDYFVYTGRLVKFVKELDKIINLFNNINEKLLIIGTGTDENYLKSIAGNNIIFLGYLDYENDKQDQKDYIEILQHAKGLINITKESFGIVTAQALALGIPIFGYNQGGSVELVDSKSGILVDKKDFDSLLKGLKTFQNTKFDRNYIKTTFCNKYLKYSNTKI